MMRVSLKNLKEASDQEVFDQVATHLLQQGRQSIKNSRCMYHLGDLACAAGCLIADDEYDPRWESSNWARLVREGFVSPAHEDMITDLQCIHDSVGPHMWPERLLRVARDYNLSAQKVMANVASFNERI